MEDTRPNENKKISNLKIKKKKYFVGKPVSLKLTYSYTKSKFKTHTPPQKTPIVLTLKKKNSQQTIWLKSTFAYQDNQSKYKYYCNANIPPLSQPGQYQVVINDQYTGKKFTFKEPISIKREKINVVFLVDNSGSMRKNDPKKRRYSAIFDIAKDNTLKQQIDSIGILGFNDIVTIIAPFTPVKEISQYKTILKKKKKKLTRGKTDIANAFNKAAKFIKEQSKNKKKKTVLIFLTDGVSSYDYYDNHLKVSRLGIPIYTVGLHSLKNGTEYNEKFLKKISKESRGYFFKGNNRLVKTLYQNIIKKSVKQIPKVDIISLKQQYYANESVVVGYQGTKNQKYFLKVINKNRNLELLYKRGSKHFYAPLPKGKHLITVQLKQKGKKILEKQYRTLVIEKHAPLSFDNLLHFKQLNPYAINTESYSLVNDFKTPMLMEWIYPEESKSNFIFFEESPFWIGSHQRRIQTIRFLPGMYSLEKHPTKDKVSSFLLKTEQGVFVYQFSYNFSVKQNQKYLEMDYLK